MPENIPVYSSIQSIPEELNILLVGKHSELTDTIMFLNLNTETRMASVISIPRDFDYDGRKINSYYSSFGIHALVSAVEGMTGRKIDHYIVVDMYVFIDIINAIGGVPVTLEEALVDPTYRTCDANGVCSTLYYPAGDYVLNGVEALRIARSRYTTSDFDRAIRQQLILEGLQEKAQSLGLGDASKVMEILGYMINATETDITLDEAIVYYFRYQNFDLNTGHVLSSDNVLASGKQEVPYETSLSETICTETVDKEAVTEAEIETESCTTTYYIYTLNGDINTIRWYVDQVLAGNL